MNNNNEHREGEYKIDSHDVGIHNPYNPETIDALRREEQKRREGINNSNERNEAIKRARKEAIEREQYERRVQDRKDKARFFIQHGGKEEEIADYLDHPENFEFKNNFFRKKDETPLRNTINYLKGKKRKGNSNEYEGGRKK